MQLYRQGQDVESAGNGLREVREAGMMAVLLST